MRDAVSSKGAMRSRRHAFGSAAAIQENAALALSDFSRPARKCVVVVGEFNSGKTTLVNTLAGGPVLAASFIDHTTHPTVVRFATKPGLSAVTTGRRRVPVTWDAVESAALERIRELHVGAPLERLRSISVIDTPGLGFADGESDGRSLQACRRADAVIWCTPAMQAWKASEERAWRSLPGRVRARGILAVTFADEIASQVDADRLLARLRAEAGPYFRTVVMASECADLVLFSREWAHVRQDENRVMGPRSQAGLANAQLR